MLDMEQFAHVVPEGPEGLGTDDLMTVIRFLVGQIRIQVHYGCPGIDKAVLEVIPIGIGTPHEHQKDDGGDDHHDQQDHDPFQQFRVSPSDPSVAALQDIEHDECHGHDAQQRAPGAVHDDEDAHQSHRDEMRQPDLPHRGEVVDQHIQHDKRAGIGDGVAQTVDHGKSHSQPLVQFRHELGELVIEVDALRHGLGEHIVCHHEILQILVEGIDGDDLHQDQKPHPEFRHINGLRFLRWSGEKASGRRPLRPELFALHQPHYKGEGGKSKAQHAHGHGVQDHMESFLTRRHHDLRGQKDQAEDGSGAQVISLADLKVQQEEHHCNCNEQIDHGFLFEDRRSRLEGVLGILSFA